MKSEKWSHDVLDSSGICVDEFGNTSGAVVTVPNLTFAFGGCGIPGCNCSNGYWICINLGYNSKKKKVFGLTIHFKDEDEMLQFLGNIQGIYSVLTGYRFEDERI